MYNIRLPHDEELEKLILGLCLYSDTAFTLISQNIASRDFNNPKNSRIFDTLQDMARLGEPIDLPLFCSFARNAGNLEACGGYAHISSLLDGLPRSTEKNTLYYCRKLRLLSLRREIIKRCYKVIAVSNGLDPNEEIIMLRNGIEKYIGFKEEANHGRRDHDSKGIVLIS